MHKIKMKYLDLESLIGVNKALSALLVANQFVVGRIDAYSRLQLKKWNSHWMFSILWTFCAVKKSGADRKLYRDVNIVPTPETDTRVFCDLAATMNAAYPDFDFSSSPEVFVKCDRHEAGAKLGRVLTSAYSVAAPFTVDDFWTAIEREITPTECDVYTYTGDNEIFGDAMFATCCIDCSVLCWFIWGFV